MLSACAGGVVSTGTRPTEDFRRLPKRVFRQAKHQRSAGATSPCEIDVVVPLSQPTNPRRVLCLGEAKWKYYPHTWTSGSPGESVTGSGNHPSVTGHDRTGLRFVIRCRIFSRTARDSARATDVVLVDSIA